ncbi:MAG: hypothetical protein Q4P05_03340 [Actinomycetaceae bacterium]|nr:hypothetical protein [Actinomycetaceae bacterium]
MSTPWAYAGWTALLLGAVVIFILLRKRATSDVSSPAHREISDLPGDTPTTAEHPSEATAAEIVASDTPASPHAASTLDPESDDETVKDSSHPHAPNASDEEDSDTVLIEASQPRDVFDLDYTVRSLRLELWASRWMLGDDACAKLADALTSASARVTSCLCDTVAEGDNGTHLPPDCARLNAVIAQLEEIAQPLRSLRATKYQHALVAVSSESDVEVFPHPTNLQIDPEIYHPPTYGLHRLVHEVSDGLENARLDIARVAPTAGSAHSRQLRYALAQATAAVNSVIDRLRTLTDTSGHAVALREEFLALEKTVCRAVWWRHFIEISVTLLTAREWALTCDDRSHWHEVAALALARAGVVIDLFPTDVPARYLRQLGRWNVIVEADATSSATYRSIAEGAQSVIDMLVSPESKS